jgi:hypothetical protein
MSHKRISELNFTTALENSDLIPVVQSGETKKVAFGSLFGSLLNLGVNQDTLGGSLSRTLYTQTETIAYTEGNQRDLLSASAGNFFGSRNMPSEFFGSSGNYVSKIIHFRTFGGFDPNDNDSTFNVFLQIGNNTITPSSIGNVTLSQAKGHPMEVLGEIIFSNGTVRACYSLGHCNNQGEYKRYPLSDATTAQNVTGFSGGDLKLIVSGSTNIKFTTYAGYIQVFN